MSQAALAVFATIGFIWSLLFLAGVLLRVVRLLLRRINHRHMERVHDEDARGLCQYRLYPCLCFSVAGWRCTDCDKRLCTNHVYYLDYTQETLCEWCRGVVTPLSEGVPHAAEAG